MLSAGIESLNDLGLFVTIDMLVKDWGIYTHKEIEEMPYHFIFDKLLLMKKQADIQEALIIYERKKVNVKIYNFGHRKILATASREVERR